jgi:16S rRNA (guanine966-N2)-methyltransferase
MRIIAGEWRGRKLLAPTGETTRPITDRVKQSVFDVLAPRMDGARVYDCFSGTGSLGLECLSRGAAGAVFFESDTAAIVQLRKNISVLGAESRARVMTGDVFRWFSNQKSVQDRVDIVFLDPPYRFLNERGGELKSLAKILAERHLAPGGLLVLRRAIHDHLDLPPLQRYDLRDYGSMAVEFLTDPGL